MHGTALYRGCAVLYWAWVKEVNVDTRSVRIDSEFHALIPPLAADELALLEASILAEGCRDAIVVWQGPLLDDHNRHAICIEHGLAVRPCEYPGR